MRESYLIVPLDTLVNDAIAKARRVRSVRMLTGKTRQALHRIYDIHPNTLKIWESPKNNQNGLTRKGAKRLAQMLEKEQVQCSVDWLLYGTGESPKQINLNALNEICNKSWNNEQAIFQEIQFFKKIHYNATVILVTDDLMQPFYQCGDYVGGIWCQKKDIHRYINENSIIEFDGSRLTGRFTPTYEKNFYTIIGVNSQKKIFSSVMIEKVAPIIWHRKRLY